ncbi:MAG: hypothetical protein IT215_03540 [Chitinophagaceae bacterium]|nr:hypothetical protein [Chitinophagaceae bacterium]
MNFKILSYHTNHTHTFLGFYGYGQNANVFNPFVRMIESHSNFIAFDLPYLDSDETYNKQEFTQFISRICEQKGIGIFSIISYSIGCRYALCLSEKLASKILNLFLIAPDGIQISKIYLIATQSKIGRGLFLGFLKISTPIISIFYFFNKNFYYNEKFQFIFKNIQDKSKQKRLYNCWTKMKYMIPDLKIINHQIEIYSFQLISFFGKNDFIIKIKAAAKLKNQIPTAEIHLIDKGHQIFTHSTFQQIAAYY